MRMRTVLYLFILVGVGVLVAANWELLVRPTEVDLLISTASVPAILIGAVLIGTVLLVDWAFHAATEERQQQLRQVIETEGARIPSQIEKLHGDVNARLGGTGSLTAPARARVG
jgi:hypothetical protein